MDGIKTRVSAYYDRALAHLRPLPRRAANCLPRGTTGERFPGPHFGCPAGEITWSMRPALQRTKGGAR